MTHDVLVPFYLYRTQVDLRSTVAGDKDISETW